MSGRDHRGATPPAALPIREAARLAALERLFAGALHTFNNALTAIGGEASFLLDDAKADPAVEEACQAVLSQVERCGRLSHRLLGQRDGGRSADDELDLVSVVVELRGLLAETLGARVRLAIDAADGAIRLRGERDLLELTVVSLVHHAVESAEGSVGLRLDIGDDGGEPRLDLHVEAAALRESAAESLLDPRLADDALARVRLEAVASAATALGARCHAQRTSPSSWSARLRFPRFGDA